jgi:hypothetical protein
MDYFARLGGLVERLWSERNREEEALPDAAEEAVRELPPVDHFDGAAFVREFLSLGQQATRQLAPVGAFGQPGITAYFGREFVVDVYFWINALAAIHNHPFCGLFTILRGCSLHNVYDFVPSERISARMSLGAVRLRKIEILREGDVRLFSLRDRPLIHTLLHVPIPSISLVIRTLRTVDYVRYLPPSVSVAMSDPDDFIARQLRLIETLRVARDPAYGTLLAEFLAHADFETTFRVLSGASADPPELERLLALGRARHGARMDLLPEVLARGVKAIRENGLREQYSGDDDRFIASLLLSAETRAQVLSTMRARYGEAEDPVARLSRWVDSCGQFEPDDLASRTVARALVEGAAPAERLARLAAIGPATPEEVASFCAGSIFSALGR